MTVSGEERGRGGEETWGEERERRGGRERESFESFILRMTVLGHG